MNFFFLFKGFLLTSGRCHPHPDSHADSTSSGSRRSASRCSPPLGPVRQTPVGSAGSTPTHQRPCDESRLWSTYLDVPLEVKEVDALPVAAVQGQNVPGLRVGETFAFSPLDKRKHTQPCTRRTDAVGVHSPGRPGRSGTA